MKQIALVLIALSSVRCASIVHGTSQKIPVTSQPPGADVVVKCIDGEFKAPSQTPTQIVLRRNRQDCEVRVEKPSFEPHLVQLSRNMSGWYLGNILIGGIIGLIVDAANGAMYTQSPGQIHAVLKEQQLTLFRGYAWEVN